MPTSRFAQVSAPKPFTNREDKIEAFFKHFEKLERDEPTVLVYYGVGGIGKSRLKDELIRQINTKKIETLLSYNLDFQTASYRDPMTALKILRDELTRKYELVFPIFDIAYVYYWNQINPHTPISRAALPFEDYSILFDLFSTLEDAPLVGFIPKLGTLLDKAIDKVQEWHLKRTKEVLKDLTHLKPFQVLDRLPVYLAEDINHQLERKNQKLIIFLDTYEGLWGNRFERISERFLKKDEWIRDLVCEIKSVYWVISGREKLRWDMINNDNWSDVIQQYQITEFSVVDATKYLIASGITDQQIIQIILESSKGLPFYLELQANTFERISANRVPTLNDFGGEYPEIIARFIKYLDQEETETLKVISSARIWDEELFVRMVSSFATGYPATGIRELAAFSFITINSGSNTFTMHTLMQELLQKNLEPSLFKKTHEFLFDYYQDQLHNADSKNISSSQETALIEGFYHLTKCCDIEFTIDWLEEKHVIFTRAAKWSAVLPLYEELIELMGDVSILDNKLAQVYNSISIIHRDLGNLEDAEKYANTTLEIRRKLYKDEDILTGDSLFVLGSILVKQGRYKEAQEQFDASLAILLPKKGEINTAVFSLYNSLGNVHSKQGNIRAAQHYYQNSQRIAEQLFIHLTEGGTEPSDSASIPLLWDEVFSEYARFNSNQSTLLREEGASGHALMSHMHAHSLFEFVFGDKHPDTAAAENNIGVSFIELGEFEEAERHIIRAFDTRKELFGEDHLDIADSYFTLSSLYKARGHLNEAHDYLQKALDIRRLRLPQYDRAIGACYVNIASIKLNQNKKGDAIEYYGKAIGVYKIAFNKNHPLIATLYSNRAYLYRQIRNYKKAIDNFEEALLIAKANSEPSGVGSLYTEIGKAYIAWGKRKSAASSFQKAIRTFETIGDFTKADSVRELLRNLFR